MLDVAPTELRLVAAVALIVLGPKDLPKAMRFVGHWVGRARGVARQFRSGFDEMVREAEFAEMEKKWAAENERIMRDYPPAGALAAPDTATPVDEPAAVEMTPAPEVKGEPELPLAPPSTEPETPAAAPASDTPRP